MNPGKAKELALGVIAAFGGFVDTDELVFNTGAGAHFGFRLLWALGIGVIGIIVYGEMSGRVSVITRRPLMGLVRERLCPAPARERRRRLLPRWHHGCRPDLRRS